MFKKFVFKLLSFIGYILYPILFLYNDVKRYTDLLYPQIRKYTLSKPHPKVFFLGRHIDFVGSKNIVIGERVKVSDYSTLSTWKVDDYNPLLQIGDDTKIGAFAHISCLNDILIGNSVLIGKFVTITDNSHGRNTLEDINISPCNRNLYSKGKVVIEDYVWIGDKVTILPGVTIGKCSIIGANSVVTSDIPPFVVACGNPARIIKKII